MLIHQLIEQGSQNAVALKYDNHEVTYGQLQDMVSLFRDYFFARGITQGENVGLFCRNCPEFIYCYFAITSLGAVVVPVNLMLTPREIAYIVKDAQINTMVTMQHLELPQEINQLVLPEFFPTLDRLFLDPAPVFSEIDEEKECVIIYTSGTTGYPKGAILTHKNLISNAETFAQFISVTEDDNFLSVLPMFHSFAWTVTVLSPLIRGAGITIMTSFLPKDAISTIRERGVTVVSGVPSMYNFYNFLGTEEDFSNVRLFLSGGAALPVEVLNQFISKINKPIMEGYGLSEASPVVTMNPLNKGKAGSIGVPIPGVEVKIVDDQGNDLPAGGIGELITKGPNVMKEYLNLPEATEKTVVDGWLHTGDLAYKDEEGYYFIVDRLKDLIIVGGLNIYPREVEEVIYQYPGIREAAVIGVPDKVRGEAVCAFIVIEEETKFEKKPFMKFLQTNLANYKLPREIIQLETLPKNAPGKILKKELKEKYAPAKKS